MSTLLLEALPFEFVMLNQLVSPYVVISLSVFDILADLLEGFLDPMIDL